MTPTSPRTDQDPATGRFVKGNRAARKHGLRAHGGDDKRSRTHEAGWLLRGLETELGEEGRTLPKRQLAPARRWCELQVVAQRCWDVLVDRQFPLKLEESSKVWETYLSSVRLQEQIGVELKLSLRRVRTCGSRSTSRWRSRTCAGAP